MDAAHSRDVRDKVFEAVDRGTSKREIADLFSVSESWVRRLIQR